MILPTQAVNEFIEIYKRKVGKTLTFDEANIKAEKFLRLMVLITEAPKKTNLNINLTNYEKQ